MGSSTPPAPWSSSCASASIGTSVGAAGAATEGASAAEAVFTLLVWRRLLPESCSIGKSFSWLHTRVSGGDCSRICQHPCGAKQAHWFWKAQRVRAQGWVSGCKWAADLGGWWFQCLTIAFAAFHCCPFHNLLLSSGRHWRCAQMLHNNSVNDLPCPRDLHWSYMGLEVVLQALNGRSRYRWHSCTIPFASIVRVIGTKSTHWTSRCGCPLPKDHLRTLKSHMILYACCPIEYLQPSNPYQRYVLQCHTKTSSFPKFYYLGGSSCAQRKCIDIAGLWWSICRSRSGRCRHD